MVEIEEAKRGRMCFTVYFGPEARRYASVKTFI